MNHDKPQPAKKKSNASIWSLLVIIGILFLYSYFTKGGIVSDDKPSCIVAKTISREIVKRMLKSPASAEFGDYTCNENTDGSFKITSYVDSQNGFGAMLRANYTVTLKYKSGEKYDASNWEVIDVDIK